MRRATYQSVDHRLQREKDRNAWQQPQKRRAFCRSRFAHLISPQRRGIPWRAGHQPGESGRREMVETLSWTQWPCDYLNQPGLFQFLEMGIDRGSPTPGGKRQHQIFQSLERIVPQPVEQAQMGDIKRVWLIHGLPPRRVDGIP